MNVTCPKCGAAYEVHADRVPGEGIDMKCSKCLHTFKVQSPSAAPSRPPSSSSADFSLKGVTFLGGQPAASVISGEEAGERFFIQRKSGKVFGPFEKRLIVQMLKAGKLTGDEGVSRDKSFWVPLTSIPEFLSAMEGQDGVDPRGMTQIPGRPGPMMGSDEPLPSFSEEFASLDRPGNDPSRFDISNLPGLGDEIDLNNGDPSSAELPGPRGFGAELPAPKGFGGGAELPVPRGFGGEPELPRPKNFVGESELPAPKGFGGGAELPRSLGGEVEAQGGRLGGRTELPVSRSQGVGGFEQPSSEMPISRNADSQDFFRTGFGTDNAFGGGLSNVRAQRDIGGPSGFGDADIAPKGFADAGDDLFDDPSSEDGASRDEFDGVFGSFQASDNVAAFGPGSVDFGGSQGFTVEVEHSQVEPLPPLTQGRGSSGAFDDSADEGDSLPSLPDLDAANGSKAPEPPGKKAPAIKKKGRVAPPLAAAIGLLAVALIIVVGLILFQSGIFGDDPVAPAPVVKEKDPVEVVKPVERVANFDKLTADTYSAYKAYIEETRKELESKEGDVVLKSQLVVGYVLYLAHYPEDLQYKDEAIKLGKELAGQKGEEAALGRGALAILDVDSAGAATALVPITKGERYAYTAHLLLGLDHLMAERSGRKFSDASTPTPTDEEAPKAPKVEEGEEAPKGEEGEGADDPPEGEEAPKVDEDEEAPKAPKGEEAPAQGDAGVAVEGDAGEAGSQGVEMDLVDEVMAEEELVEQSRQKSLSHLKEASKIKPEAPAPRYFAALLEKRATRTEQARALLVKLLVKSPEHVPALLELSMLAYLNGDLNVARDHALPVTGKLQAAASKRERSQSHLLVGLVHVARRQSTEAVTALIESLKIDPSNEEALKALGEEFFRNGKFEEALNYFTTNASLSQSDPEVMLGVVKSHIGLEQFDKAVQKLEAGIKAFPTNARFPFLLGLIHEKEGYWFEAQQRYRSALQIDPDFSKSRVRLALLLLRDDKRDEATALLDEAEKRGAARDADVAVDIGQAYLMMNDQARALAALQTALKLNASNLDARIRLSRYHLDQGESEKALAMLEPFMETKVLDTELATLLSDVFRARGQYERSIEQLDKLIEADPKNEQYVFKRGLSYFGWKNYDTAKDQFLKAYRMNPNFPETYFYAGRVEFEQKNYGQAMKIFRAVLDEDQANGHYRYYLAYALEKNDNNTQALEEYTSIDRFDPKYGAANPELFYRRGRILAMQGNYRLAKRDLAEALQRDPDHLGALLSMGDTLFDERDYERAVVLYDRALKQRDDLSLAHYRKGQALIYLKQTQEAIREIERAHALDLKEAKSHEELAFLYRDVGNSGSAIRHFKTYLSMEPKAPNRKEIEKQIVRLGGRP